MFFFSWMKTGPILAAGKDLSSPCMAALKELACRIHFTQFQESVNDTIMLTPSFKVTGL